MARLAAHRDRLHLTPARLPGNCRDACFLLSVELYGTIKMMSWEGCHVEREPLTLPLAASAPLPKHTSTLAKTLLLNHTYVRL